MQPSIADDVDPAEALAALFLGDAQRFDAAAKQLARGNHSVDIPITGTSMGANLPKGTVVRVALTDAASCNAGDIVVFRLLQRVVAHRLIHRTDSYLLTRGDARFSPDPPIPNDRVLGRVTGIVASGALLPLQGFRHRSALVRAIKAMISEASIVALRISPALALGFSRLVTVAERLQRGARADEKAAGPSL